MDFKQASEMRYNIQPAETFAEPMVYTKHPTPETKEYGKLIASGYYNGLNYYVKNIGGRHPTAYIEIPQGHRAYNMDFYEGSENHVSLNVHWGVTFQECYLRTVDDNGSRGHKFIGWDYGHAGDFAGYYIGDKRMEDLNYKKMDHRRNYCGVQGRNRPDQRSCKLRHGGKMNVDYELLQRGCLTAREIRLKQERIREATPERKAQHKRWAQSDAGRRSDLERHRRYRATEKGRLTARAKSRRHWLKVKDDPEWRAHRLEVQTMWKHKKMAERLNGEHTLWLMGGVVKVNMGRAA